MLTPRQRKWVWAPSLLILALLAAFWFWPRGYGRTSPEGYRFAVALFSACNQRDEEKLDTIDQMIDQSLDKGQLGTTEAAWLRGIVSQGRRGNWAAASRDVRQLMNDQLQPNRRLSKTSK